MKASSILSLETDSSKAAKSAAEAILKDFGPDKPTLFLVYGTINHDQSVLLDAVRATVGPEPAIVGCSAQGVVTNGRHTEEGYGLAVMGFGGSDLRAVGAVERDIRDNPRAKGRSLAVQLRSKLGRDPGFVCLHYDASQGTNVQEMLAGMRAELSCPVVGGGASLSWGLPVATYQYFGAEAFRGGAVAFALEGPFDVEVGVCAGTTPTGVVMTVTRSQANEVLELDGRPAADVFSEATGHVKGELLRQDHLTSWAIALERMVPTQGPSGVELRPFYLIRVAIGIDYEKGAVRAQAAIPEGERVAFHHRSVAAMLEGTKMMGRDLAQRLAGRQPWAVLGFECRARTVPFLGPERTLEEHDDLCSQIGRDIPWIGMMAWGEIAPVGGEPSFHNYTYPLAVLVRRSGKG